MSGSARALSPQLALVPLVIPLLGIVYGIVTNKVWFLAGSWTCRLLPSCTLATYTFGYPGTL
jgi:hypothetical protein